jgi:RNA methyltransferase, TrmH family
MDRLPGEELRTLVGLRRPAGREASGRLLIPGYNCLDEYLRAGLLPERLLVLAGAEDEVRDRLGPAWNRLAPLARSLREHELVRLADQPRPEAVLAVGPAPASVREPGPPQLILDGLADPGNLGAILRTALWFGIDRIWLCGSAVDPWSPRAIRAATGHAFHLRQLRRVSAGDLAALASGGARLVGLDSGQGRALGDYGFQPGEILVVGGESHGLADSVPWLAERLHIAGGSAGESLNAGHAFAIAAWQRHRSLRDTD